MPIITVPHVKGGCGKSTTVANLAVELAQRGEEVLLVDSDPSVRTLSNWQQDREEAGLPTIPVVHKSGMLHKTLLELQDKYQWVIVDVPGKDSQEMRTALTASDLAVIPVLPSQPDVDATIQTMSAILTEAQEYNSKQLKQLVVLTKVPTHVFGDEADQATRILSRHYQLAPVRIHDRKIYRTSLSEGSAAPEAANSKAKAEIRGLVDIIINTINEVGE